MKGISSTDYTGASNEKTYKQTKNNSLIKHTKIFPAAQPYDKFYTLVNQDH